MDSLAEDGAEAADQDRRRQGIKHHGYGGMQQDARDVISAGTQPERGMLDLEQDPGQRLVDAELEGRPGPADLCPPQAAIVDIIQEVILVIEGADEPIVEHGEEGGTGRQADGQPQDSEEPSPTGGRADSRSRGGPITVNAGDDLKVAHKYQEADHDCPAAPGTRTIWIVIGPPGEPVNQAGSVRDDRSTLRNPSVRNRMTLRWVYPGSISGAAPAPCRRAGRRGRCRADSPSCTAILPPG